MSMSKRPIRGFLWFVLALVARLVPRASRMTVLLYHSISDGGDFFAVSPGEFRRQMEYLKQQMDIVPLERAFRHAKGEQVLRNSIAITFDDGYQDFLTSALPILQELGIPATVFVLGDSPDRAQLENDLPLLTSEQLRTLGNEPLVTVGSHALSHKKLTRLSLEELHHELTESSLLITERTGATPRYLAYPKGAHNQVVMEATASNGYRGGCSVIERAVRVGDNPYTLPRIQIDASTNFSLFRTKLSIASDWYYALWSLKGRPKAK